DCGVRPICGDLARDGAARARRFLPESDAAARPCNGPCGVNRGRHRVQVYGPAINPDADCRATTDANAALGICPLFAAPTACVPCGAVCAMSRMRRFLPPPRVELP